MLLLFSDPVMSDSLCPHGLQHTRPPWPSPSPGSCPSSCPLHQWCHPAISSSDAPFLCPQSFPASGTSPMSQLFTSDDQNTGASALESVLQTSIQSWFPLRLTGLMSLLFKDPSHTPAPVYPKHGPPRCHCRWWCSHEIKRRLLLGRKAMPNLDSILKSRDITLPTKVHLVKAMVFPVVMYGCESLTIKKAECWTMDAFELWCWRRLLRVPWTVRRSNQSILKEISPEYSLEGLFIHWCWRWSSNTLTTWLIRKDPNARKDWRQEEKGMTEDEMVGWHHWLNSTDMSLSKLQEVVKDREAWHAAAHGDTKSQTRLCHWTTTPPLPNPPAPHPYLVLCGWETFLLPLDSEIRDSLPFLLVVPPSF